MFTADDLASMRACQEDHMQDTCELLRCSESGTDAYGMPYKSFVLVSTSDCGLNTKASREMLNAEAHVFDAQLRLPYDTEITNIDRVRITHRFGEMLETPVEYDILGNPMAGPSGLVLNLRSVP